MARPSAVRALFTSALVVLAVQTVAPAAGAAANHKSFSEKLSVDGGAAVPGEQQITAGTSQTFDFTITNTSSGSSAVPFGSLQIVIPTGITNMLTSLLAPPANFSVVGASTSTPTVVSTGPTGSGIAPNASITVRVTGDVAATGICPATWNTEVKQSNDFSGTGNDFMPQNTVSTPVADSARLVWTQQPSDLQFDTGMSPAPAVSGVDACGNAVAPGTVTLTPAGGALASTGATASGTSVSFANLTFTSYAFYGDTLTASATGFQPATSAAFDVVQKLVPCPLGIGCASGNVTDTGKTTTASIVTATNNTGSTQHMTVSVTGTPPASCGEPAGTTPEQSFGSPATLKLTGSLSKTVTLTLPKTYVNTLPNNGTPFMDICLYNSSAPFVDKFGQTGTTGLLPGCSSTVGPPCIVSRNKNAGNEVIVFALLPGDPSFNFR